jgi:hypothetical protein
MGFNFGDAFLRGGLMGWSQDASQKVTGDKNAFNNIFDSTARGMLGGSGNITNQFSGGMGGSNHVNSDGSGVYGAGGAPTVDAQTGELVPNTGFDIGKMFEQFQKMQTEPGSEVYDPNAHADLIKSRYPWIPQQAFQQWLASQPQTPSIQFAGQPRL